MGPLGELGALFNPGMRHEMEERRAKQMLREEEGTGRKGRLGIDLESGVAVIPSGTPAAPADGTAPDPVRDEGGCGEPANDGGKPVHESGEPANDARPPTHDGRTPGKADPRPGQPQPADRSGSAVPSGKARRQANGRPPGPAPTPTGKSRHSR